MFTEGVAPISDLDDLGEEVIILEGMKESIELEIKVVSTNMLYGHRKNGQRFKKQDAIDFEEKIEWLLKIFANNIRLPVKCDLELITRVFVSRKFDTSNCLKLFEDCLARHFKINDRRFSGHRISRIKVKEGQEKIRFLIQEFNDEIYDI